MPSVPESVINLYQWITYLTPIWGILLVILWSPIKNLYNKLFKKPTNENSKRLDKIEDKLVQIDRDLQQRRRISRALLHHEIFQTARQALEKGYISEYELENLDELYKPYKAIGGNGTAEKLYNDCKDLPIRR